MSPSLLRSRYDYLRIDMDYSMAVDMGVFCVGDVKTPAKALSYLWTI